MSVDNTNPVLTAVVAAAWMVLFSAMWALIERLGMSMVDTYPMVQIVTMRYSMHLFLLLAFALLCGNRKIFRTAKPAWQVGRGFCMFIMPASFLLFASAAGSKNLWSVFWLSPILVLVIARMFVSEKASYGIWLACLIGFFAVVGVIGPDVSRLDVAGLMPVGGALSFAVYVVITRHIRSEAAMTSLLYTGLVALVCMAPLALANWSPLQNVHLVKIAGIGVVSLVMLYSLDRALEIAPTTFVAPLLYSVVVAELVLELLRDGVVPGVREMVASTVVLVVALLAFLSLIHMDRKRAG